MDQHIYVYNILKAIMIPYADEHMPLKLIFMQDNDPKHTSKKAKAFLQQQKIDLIKWPSQSTDMNPIEQLWKDLKVSLANKKTKNYPELQNAVQEAWKAIPIDKSRRLIDA